MLTVTSPLKNHWKGISYKNSVTLSLTIVQCEFHRIFGCSAPRLVQFILRTHSVFLQIFTAHNIRPTTQFSIWFAQISSTYFQTLFPDHISRPYFVGSHMLCCLCDISPSFISVKDENIQHYSAFIWLIQLTKSIDEMF